MSFKSLGDPFKDFAKDLKRGSSGVPMSVKSYLDLVAGRILAEAKKRAPVKTGALRRSGRIENADTSQGPVRIISFGGQGTGVQYAAAVEFGRFVPVGRQRGSITTPQPFLRPALIKEMKRTKPALKKVLQQNLSHLNRTYGGRS